LKAPQQKHRSESTAAKALLRKRRKESVAGKASQ